ncbi:MAG: glycoside hydrolase family 125 protein, partial [Dermabacter sp.]|nr:glycoside hydrolase family 125 protein [Dermabacter sp.]
STHIDEKRAIVELLLATTGGTGYMHEGVDCNDPTAFTREWFSWSNAMFSELALDVAGISRPSLVAEPLL